MPKSRSENYNMPTRGESRPPERGSRRLKPKFGDRKQFPLRLPRDLHQAITDLCAAAPHATNSYICAALGIWLANESNKRLVTGAGPGTSSDRVTVTVRFPLSLFTQVKQASSELSISMNALIVEVLQNLVSVEDRRRRT